MAQEACVACGKAVDDVEQFQSEDGPVCAACTQDTELADLFRRGTERYAWGAFGLFWVSVFVDPFAIVSLLSVGTGLKFFKDFRTIQVDHQAAMADRSFVPLSVAGIAVIFGVMSIVELIVDMIL